MRTLVQLVVVQFKEFAREPGILFWSLGFPAIMAWILGIAFTKQGEIVRNVALVRGERPAHEVRQLLESASLVDSAGPHRVFRTSGEPASVASGSFRIAETTWEEAIVRVKRGQAILLMHERSDSVHVYFDPVNPEAELAYLHLAARLDTSARRSGTIIAEPLSERGLRYIDFLVPGLIAMGIMMSAMWGISYSLIEKRIKKLLRRMVATPMKKSVFLLSHFLSRTVLSAAESLLLFVFAWWYFDVTVEGSLAALTLLFVAGNMAFTGMAVLVSSRTRNAEVGNGLINAVVLPMMIGSGIFFSYHNFPEWLVPYIEPLPLTMLADSMRQVFIEGAGIAAVWMQALVLAAFGAALFVLGQRMYRWY
jgi:ABC-type multidrug transport system permease subunit